MNVDLKGVFLSARQRLARGRGSTVGAETMCRTKLVAEPEPTRCRAGVGGTVGPAASRPSEAASLVTAVDLRVDGGSCCW